MKTETAKAFLALLSVVIVHVAYSSKALADGNWFYVGACTLDEALDVEGDDITSQFDVCLRGRGGGQMNFVSGNANENFATSYLRGGVGVHAFEYISLFGEGHALRRVPLGDDATQSTDSSADLLLARIGNASIHGLSLAIGRFAAPFGIGIEEGSESYRFFADEFHWRTYEYGTWVSWDDEKNFFIDLSYVAETFRGEDATAADGTTRAADWGGSFRVGYDFSALEGSRLVASAYGQNSGMRRSGLGFITVNSRGDTNWIEFVRTRLTPDSKRDPFRQIITFGYLSAPRAGGRWSVRIEEDRFHQRMSEVSHHISILGYGDLTLGLLLRRTLASPYQDRWHFTSGLEVAL